MKQNPNIAMLEEVAKALDELRDEVVFVGGSTTALYIDDPASPAPMKISDAARISRISVRSSRAALI